MLGSIAVSNNSNTNNNNLGRNRPCNVSSDSNSNGSIETSFTSTNTNNYLFPPPVSNGPLAPYNPNHYQQPHIMQPQYDGSCELQSKQNHTMNNGSSVDGQGRPSSRGSSKEHRSREPKSNDEKIGNYEVLDLLGKGGFACVYRALSNKTGQYVAIKMIDKKLMKSANMAGRVKNEAEIHCQLKHPSIVELYTYFEDKHYVYMVMELCAKGELYTYMRANQKIFTEFEAQKLFREVIEGVVYLHSHGIIHRDLSLANLLLTHSDHIKISDFGLATRMTDVKQQHFTMCGTPNFISPEIASRNAHSFETDVWSLGSMLYTFLVGRPPFDTENIKSTLTKVVNAQFEIPHHLSANAQDLIHSLLKKNPAQRLKLFEILDHPFMKQSQLMTVNAIPTSKSQDMSNDSGNYTMGRNGTVDSSANFKNSSQRSSSIYPEAPMISKHTSNSTEDLPPKHPSNGSGIVHTNDDDMLRNRQYHRSRSMENSMVSEKSENVVKSRTNSVECPSKKRSSAVNGGQKSSKSGNDRSFSRGSSRQNSEQFSESSCSRLPPTAPISSSQKSRDRDKESKTETSLCMLTPPLDSSRLKPIKQVTKNATISILEDCTVLLEFSKTTSKKEKVLTALSISSDGMKISLVEPSVKSNKNNLACDNSKAFTYHNLPAKHWKRYQYAARFVQIIRSNTPKVTLYNSSGKFMLMDNAPNHDCEAVYRSSNAKVRKSKDGIKVVDSLGENHVFDNSEQIYSYHDTNVKELFVHASKAFSYCEKVEKGIKDLEETLSTDYHESLFPITVGKRMSSISPSSTPSSNAQSQITMTGGEFSTASFGPISLSSTALVSLTSKNGSSDRGGQNGFLNGSNNSLSTTCDTDRQSVNERLSSTIGINMSPIQSNHLAASSPLVSAGQATPAKQPPQPQQQIYSSGQKRGQVHRHQEQQKQQRSSSAHPAPQRAASSASSVVQSNPGVNPGPVEVSSNQWKFIATAKIYSEKLLFRSIISKRTFKSINLKQTFSPSLKRQKPYKVFHG